MMRLKQCAALLLAGALLAGLLSGCGGQEEQLELSACVGPDVSTFDPAYVTENSDATVVGNLYENLMRLTCTVSGETSVTEGIARSVDVEDGYDGTQTYTFRLRNARWSDGRELTANDFVYAWRRLVNPATNSPNASLLSMVQGYDAVRTGGDLSEFAVTAKNDHVLVVTLSGKYDWFLSEVCTAVATSPLREDVVQSLKEKAQAASSEDTPLKWWYDPTRLVTNGPYCVSAYHPGSSLTITASRYYYGKAGPDNLYFLFADDAQSARALYDSGAVDFVSPLTDERIAERMETSQGQWGPTPELSTYTVLFNMNQLPFDDVSVRKAFSLAVDRAALAQLASATGRAAEGLVPYGIAGLEEDEDFRTVGGDLLGTDPEGYAERCKEAQKLLSESSFDERYDLEYLYVDKGPAAQIAQALVQQWQDVLYVTVCPRAVTEKELKAALTSGEFLLAGACYTAGVNDAEAFLTPFESDDPRNVCGFSSSAYDTLLTIIEDASDSSARLGCLHDAEALLLDSMAVCPLYTASTAWELRETYTGLCRDSRGWFLFSGISAAG